jgi:hypothetical protein
MNEYSLPIFQEIHLLPKKVLDFDEKLNAPFRTEEVSITFGFLEKSSFFATGVQN